MDTTTLILIVSAGWFLLSILAAVIFGKMFKLGMGSDEPDISGALEGNLKDFVQGRKREAGK